MDDQQHQHQDLDIHDSNKNNVQNILKTDLDDDAHADLDQDNGRNILNHERDSFYCMDNNPPESYAVCRTKVADWLDRNTFIERNPSVKLTCSSKSQDPCQMTSSHHSINQRPKLSIIAFRKKTVHQTDRKLKHNDKVENVRLFRNRSEPGRDYCLLITEPVSPRVSCVGRVGSVRVVQGRKSGVWGSFKAAFLNLIHTNRVAKITA